MCIYIYIHTNTYTYIHTKKQLGVVCELGYLVRSLKLNIKIIKMGINRKINVKKYCIMYKLLKFQCIYW